MRRRISRRFEATPHAFFVDADVDFGVVIKVIINCGAGSKRRREATPSSISFEVNVVFNVVMKCGAGSRDYLKRRHPILVLPLASSSTSS
ncbi:unnamed protein product [Protopolystoma xenopodis]|uniref:Uncharacterized protein n=1 Tax=Protopolystoma xenopodis TaxID=117903 RepID=A0A3S5CLG1_9PLAT|nr:unnamed protein product [Protopolystoma xenopodis]